MRVSICCTGEAIAAPALNDVTCWKIEKRENRFFVAGKVEKKSKRQPKSSPASVVIIGAGAAGGAAAEMLRRERYDGRVTLVGADEFLPYDRPNLSKDYLAGNAPEEWIPLRSADFYREQKIDVLTKTSVTAIDSKKETGDATGWPFVRLRRPVARHGRDIGSARHSGRRSAARLLFTGCCRTAGASSRKQKTRSAR